MLKARQVIAINRRIHIGDLVYTVRISNPTGPDDAWLAPIGTVLPDAQGENCVLSVADDGTVRSRPDGTAGGDERCRFVGVSAIYSQNAAGRAFVFLCEP